ncbi:MAG: class I SAM-dependent methyltransferase [Nitrospirae bacterium]|nr:MAG: class I SAM-dependent methyltransferase [Nitrospirota bacterium]
MGVKLERKKPKCLLTSIVYRFSKMRLPISDKLKFRIFLNLEWIFERLCTEQASAVYGSDGIISKKSTVQFLSKHIKPDDTVLDLGCGYGAISYNVSMIAKKVVGVDYNTKAIEAAQKKYQRENLRFIHEEALNYLRKSEERFSVLILSHVLEHIDNPKDFLSAYSGYFEHIFIEVPDFDRTFLNHFRQEQNIAQLYTDADHVTEFDRDEMHSLLSDLNLEALQAEYRYGVQRFWVKRKGNGIN